MFWIRTAPISIIQSCLHLSLRFLVLLFMKIMCRQVFKILKWSNGAWGPNSNLHFHIHVLLWSFDDFPQLCRIPTGTQKIKTSANTGNILFFCLHHTKILFLGLSMLFLICYTEPYNLNFTKLTSVSSKFIGNKPWPTRMSR